MLSGESVNLSLQPAKTPVAARGQRHLDLDSGDASQSVERQLGLGATTVRENEYPDDTYVVMGDLRATSSACAHRRSSGTKRSA